ncbi:unnamed protein product [Victoria cruziana]
MFFPFVIYALRSAVTGGHGTASGVTGAGNSGTCDVYLTRRDRVGKTGSMILIIMVGPKLGFSDQFLRCLLEDGAFLQALGDHQLQTAPVLKRLLSNRLSTPAARDANSE